jgi:spermidine synthase
VIVLVGILTGFEIPLLSALKNAETEDADSAVLGVDYLGAFAGTVLFAFLFYPRAGLIPAAFIVASLNAAVGVALATQVEKVHAEKRREYWALIGVQVALLLVLMVSLPRADVNNEWFLGRYLG